MPALAVGAAARAPVLPNVASIDETGVEDAACQFRVGLSAPAKTPRAVVELSG